MPWLSDQVWRAWNEGDADARTVRITGKPVAEAWPTFVTDDDRRRAGCAAVAPGEPLPPVGTVDEHAALLASTPGQGYINLVRWPICCERLTMLISKSGGTDLVALESQVGPLDFALTEAHLPTGASDEDRFRREGGWVRTLQHMRAGKHRGEGTALFQCRVCGRVYGATCEP